MLPKMSTITRAWTSSSYMLLTSCLNKLDSAYYNVLRKEDEGAQACLRKVWNLECWYAGIMTEGSRGRADTSKTS